MLQVQLLHPPGGWRVLRDLQRVRRDPRVDRDEHGVLPQPEEPARSRDRRAGLFVQPGLHRHRWYVRCSIK